MERSYLIRYGVMSQVGRFAADRGFVFERGATVVVRSHRGTELGEVLIEAPPEDATGGLVSGPARVLRPAGSEDMERARRAEGERAGRYEDCRRVLGEGVWPLDLLDVEPLLDDRRVVLHYLGPHRLDTAGLLAVFRESCDLDVMFQPVGIDEADDHDDTHGCGSCGSEGGGCGSGGGGSACDSCGVKQLLDARR